MFICIFLDKLFMELLISLIMVHQKIPSFLWHVDWFNLFIPLLNVLDAFNLMTPNLEREEDDNLSWPGFTSKYTKIRYTHRYIYIFLWFIIVFLKYNYILQAIIVIQYIKILMTLC